MCIIHKRIGFELSGMSLLIMQIVCVRRVGVMINCCMSELIVSAI